jgi:hypothetical protein
VRDHIIFSSLLLKYDCSATETNQMPAQTAHMKRVSQKVAAVLSISRVLPNRRRRSASANFCCSNFLNCNCACHRLACALISARVPKQGTVHATSSIIEAARPGPLVAVARAGGVLSPCQHCVRVTYSLWTGQPSNRFRYLLHPFVA